MTDPITRAHAILDHAEATLREVGPTMWWTEACTLLWQIEQNPLLWDFVGEIDWQAGEWFQHPRYAPYDPVARGQQAFVGLFRQYRNGATQGTILGNPPGTSGSDVVAWREFTRGERNVYTFALIALLRHALDEQGGLNFFIERWIRRLELFTPPVTKEAELQIDLYRYLFDAGVEPHESGRESQTTKGRVDFLLRGEVPVAVELKLWQDKSSLPDVRHWCRQAADYPRDLGILHGYLIIANLSDARLVVPQVLVAGDVSIQVRVADLKRRVSSRDGARTVRELKIEELWP